MLFSYINFCISKIQFSKDNPTNIYQSKIKHKILTKYEHIPQLL